MEKNPKERLGKRSLRLYLHGFRVRITETYVGNNGRR